MQTLHHDAHTFQPLWIFVMATSKDAQTFYNVTRKRLLVRLIVDTVTAACTRALIRQDVFLTDSMDNESNGSFRWTC